MEDVNLDDVMERHWRIVFEDNDGGVYNKREFLHTNMWDVYMNEKEKIIKGGYYVEIVGSDGKRFFGNW